MSVDDEYFSEEDSFELLQQRNYINVLLDGGKVQHVNQRNKVEHRNYDMREGTEEGIDEDVAMLERMKNDLLFENKFKIQEQQGSIAEDDVFKDIEVEIMARAQGRNQQLEDEELEDVDMEFIEDLRHCLLKFDSMKTWKEYQMRLKSLMVLILITYF